MIKHSNPARIFALAVILLLPATFYSKPAPPQSSSDVNVSGGINPDKAKKGRTVRGNVLMEIPSGLHVQSNKPLDKFLVATKLDVETPSGMTVGPISYPRALMKKLKFSKSMVAGYEGRA